MYIYLSVNYNQNTGGIHLISAVIISVIFLITVFIFIYKPVYQDADFRHPVPVLASILAVSLVLRLLLGYYTPGYEMDMNCFKAWGNLVNTVGFDGVYYQNVFLDYPPGYLYILAFLDKIRQIFGIGYDAQIYILIIKLPAILFDIAAGFILYKIACKKSGSISAAIISSLYLFCPVVILDSCVWGQIDSFVVFLLLLSFNFLASEKYIFAGIFLGIGCISKPQVLIFLPVFFFWTLFHKKYKGMLIGLASVVFTMLIVCKPFASGWDYSILIQKYTETLSEYNYYSINAYNFYDLIGLNWTALPENTFLSALLKCCGPVAAAALSGFILFKSRKRPDISSAYASGAVIMSTVFMFTVKMHERYFFPCLILILITYIYVHDRRLLISFAGFSAVHFLNIAYVLYLNNTFVSPVSIQIILLSALFMIFYLYFIYTVVMIFVFGKEMTSSRSVRSASEKIISPDIIGSVSSDRSFTRKDLLLAASLTIVYSVFAFWGLGVTTMANSSWIPTENESVIFEASEGYLSLTYLPGISAVYSTDSSTSRVGCSFSVAVSDDQKTWTDAGSVTEASVYEWHEMTLTSTGKYIRITSTGADNVINEIALKSSDGSRYVALTAISGNSSELIDEQSTVPLHPSYINGTYFDEIYHARTAYEDILHVEPYENTHPPLGKYIISLGIMLFGMNPFGWRFMGALFGVLMLPVFYHMLKRLFGSSFLSFCGTTLFAFDFMHFTQTRIATIDTYSVFFILLMYDAMIIFLQKDYIHSRLKDLLIPLLLSGIFMGLGIASKWTVAYAAVGLAVLLFAKIIIVYKGVKGTKDMSAFKSQTLSLCLWCVILFISIPFAIYYCAFLPLTTLPQNIYDINDRFMAYQVHMYEYHSQLKATHYFASPWYEWPLDIRNIWYSVSYDYDGTGSVSTISCLGNPILWWSCLSAFIFTTVTAIKDKNRTASIIVIGFLSSYLPWVLVSRLTFVYHYFTSVPFIIMAGIFVMSRLSTVKKLSEPLISSGSLSFVKKYQAVCILYVVVNLALFFIFLPAISGFPTTSAYIKSLEWLPDWYFIS
jgi:dolichyl-phosphate-mannose-protein mannosyltransferase